MIKNRAVIFDMDGVIIDSEKLWKRAENEVFSSLGVQVTDELSMLTKLMTTAEATVFWYNKFPWPGIGLKEAEQMVVSRVIELIETEECHIDGIKPFIESLKTNHYRIGLATNSPSLVIFTVLDKLKITQLFDAVCSAELEKKGKPDPAVYYKAAMVLNVEPVNCIAIEDSCSGMSAAKTAGMKVVAFSNGKNKINFENADFRIENFSQAIVDRLLS